MVQCFVIYCLHFRCSPFSHELDILLQVIGKGTHQYMFVGVLYASCVYTFHVYKVDQCSQHRLYGAAAHATDALGVCHVAMQLFMHFIIQWFVDAVIKFLELG